MPLETKTTEQKPFPSYPDPHDFVGINNETVVKENYGFGEQSCDNRIKDFTTLFRLIDSDESATIGFKQDRCDI